MKNIFVGNLSFGATEDAIRSMFEAYGTVDRVSVVTDRDTGQAGAQSQRPIEQRERHQQQRGQDDRSEHDTLREGQRSALDIIGADAGEPFALDDPQHRVCGEDRCEGGEREGRQPEPRRVS